jgi:hypothetical protein
MDKVVLNLMIQVSYSVFGLTTPKEIKETLLRAGQHLYDEGLLTNDVDALVDEWKMEVKEIQDVHVSSVQEVYGTGKDDVANHRMETPVGKSGRKTKKGYRA